jgi:hypothetical protein
MQGVSKLYSKCLPTPIKVFASCIQGVGKCHSRGSEAQFKVSANYNQGVCKHQVLKLGFSYIP